MTRKSLYILSGPDGAVRYVGITKATLEQRLTQHLTHARARKGDCFKDTCHRSNWIRKCQYLIQIDLVAEVTGDGGKEEMELIAALRSIGCDLVNGTAGGEGALNPSPETRAKISASRKGMKFSPEHRAKISEAMKGRRHSLAHNAKVALAHMGRPLSADHRAKLSQANKGKTLSAAHRSKISAALTKFNKVESRLD